MVHSKRLWSEDEIAKLKSLAGRHSVKEIAAELGRTAGATTVEASKLKISLKTRRHLGPREIPGTSNPAAALD